MENLNHLIAVNSNNTSPPANRGTTERIDGMEIMDIYGEFKVPSSKRELLGLLEDWLLNLSSHAQTDEVRINTVDNLDNSLRLDFAISSDDECEFYIRDLAFSYCELLRGNADKETIAELKGEMRYINPIDEYTMTVLFEGTKISYLQEDMFQHQTPILAADIIGFPTDIYHGDPRQPSTSDFEIDDLRKLSFANKVIADLKSSDASRYGKLEFGKLYKSPVGTHLGIGNLARNVEGCSELAILTAIKEIVEGNRDKCVPVNQLENYREYSLESTIGEAIDGSVRDGYAQDVREYDSDTRV